MADTVTIELAREEALVLFDLLQREIDLANGKRLVSATEHEGELWALNGLNCMLEKNVGEAFRPEYPQLVDAARAALVERNGAWPWDRATTR